MKHEHRFTVTAVRVREMMTPTGWMDGPDSVTAAAQRMITLRASALPVCGSWRRFLGVLSIRDIVKRCTAEGLDPVLVAAESLIAPFSHQPVIGCDRPAHDRVLVTMFRNGLDWLPVVDGARWVGSSPWWISRRVRGDGTYSRSSGEERVGHVW